jgi:hypothetical protein
MRRLQSTLQAGGRFPVRACRRERHHKHEIRTAAAALRRVHVLRKAFPVPGNTGGEHLCRHAFDGDKVLAQQVMIGGPARRDADTAIAHHNGGNAVLR